MRIRTVKPEFWHDDKIAKLSLVARLVYIGTFNLADDEGNLGAETLYIKAMLFPFDTEMSSETIEGVLKELVDMGRLIPYSVNDNNYFSIKNFKKHQRINRPSAPKCPLPPHQKTVQITGDGLRPHGETSEV